MIHLTFEFGSRFKRKLTIPKRAQKRRIARVNGFPGSGIYFVPLMLGRKPPCEAPEVFGETTRAKRKKKKTGSRILSIESSWLFNDGYFLLKMGDIRASYVSLPEGTFH